MSFIYISPPCSKYLFLKISIKECEGVGSAFATVARACGHMYSCIDRQLMRRGTYYVYVYVNPYALCHRGSMTQFRPKI